MKHKEQKTLRRLCKADDLFISFAGGGLECGNCGANNKEDGG